MFSCAAFWIFFTYPHFECNISGMDAFTPVLLGAVIESSDQCFPWNLVKFQALFPQIFFSSLLFAFISETHSLHDGMLDNLDVLSFADKYSFTSPKSVYIYFHFVS
jgi:hypothetical protein